MSARKLSISLSAELFEAVEALSQRREEGRSSLLEMLLREHPMIRAEVKRQRRAGSPRLASKGRDPTELAALARTARRQWEKREAAGEVAFRDR